MEFVKLKSNKGEFLEGLVHIIPDVFNDERGYFLESWNSKKINEYLGKELIFTQDNISKSKKNVIRGLHYQMNPSPQEKLIRCLSGSIFDVAVDIRKNSKTFGQWAGVEISEKNKFQLLVPEGFAHGFLSLAEDSILYYKVTNLWDKKLEKTIKWNDKNIDIQWPLSTNIPLISAKDKSGISLEEAIKLKYIFF
tara:strand:+ start:830 stop:1411 length:582 start_codon:yes stop_codon:yes gene_type:complete